MLEAETGAIRDRGASPILGGRRGRDGDQGAGRGRRLPSADEKAEKKGAPGLSRAEPGAPLTPPGGPKPQPWPALPVLCRRCPVTTASPVTGCSQVVLLASSLQGREGTGAERARGATHGAPGPLAPAAPKPPRGASPACSLDEEDAAAPSDPVRPGARQRADPLQVQVGRHVCSLAAAAAALCCRRRC